MTAHWQGKATVAGTKLSAKVALSGAGDKAIEELAGHMRRAFAARVKVLYPDIPDIDPTRITITITIPAKPARKPAPPAKKRKAASGGGRS